MESSELLGLLALTVDFAQMWTYMYFLIHIREIEDKTELNGVESYVHEKAIRNDVSFFPITRSMRVSAAGEGQIEKSHIAYACEAKCKLNLHGIHDASWTFWEA
jgi:hypothetical protein